MTHRNLFGHAAWRSLACAAVWLAGLAGVVPAQAQLFSTEEDIFWRESDVPPAPALSTARAVRIDMPIYSDVMVGVDVDSIQVSSADGVVRYVTFVQGRDGHLWPTTKACIARPFRGAPMPATNSMRPLPVGKTSMSSGKT